MKRMLLLLPLALPAATGCVGIDPWPWKQTEATALKAPPPPPPAVQPEEVNERSAAAKLEALRAEIEYDAAAGERAARAAEAPKK
jgi:hypothetical protein